MALGLITPAGPLLSEEEALQVAGWLGERPDVSPADVRLASFQLRESGSAAEHLETAIHPISSFLIIPVFALANPGVELSASDASVGLEIERELVVGMLQNRRDAALPAFAVLGGMVVPAHINVASVPVKRTTQRH